MDFFQYALEACTLTNLLWLTIGALIGSILGALPGMSADTGIAIFLPLTFNLEPVTGLITLGAIYVTGSYGGNITAVLINTPGTSDSLFMTLDGYPMTVQGKGLRAIGITTFSAFIGGMIGSIALLFIAPPLAQIAIKFGPWELFLTTLMGLIIILGLVKGGMLKGLISASLGFLCTMIGMDGITGLSRLNFGIRPIYDEMPLLPVVLGMFAVSQVLALAGDKTETISIDKSAIKGSPFLSMKDHLSMLFNNIRSSIIGTIVGIIPGAGTTVAAGISYNLARKGDPHPETFGKGNDQGLATVSAANNAVVGGSLVPLLTLGIPGNGTSALFLGGLLIHGLAPGTQLFNRNPQTVYGLFFGLIVAQFFILLIGLFGAPIYAKVTKVPTNILIPIVGSLCILGAYTYRNLAFDNFLIIFFGVIGYYMTKANIPMAPFVLAFVLGKNTEIHFRRTMLLTGGNLSTVAFTPLAIALLAVDLIFLISPFWGEIKGLIKKDKGAAGC
ncbi:tripartite tricarboxylate transporter permease [Lutispora saccharofermentans]|uniref:Tripartite tricarboxylate transporter permease n=1 Tax=Lutispora saccharofermentans TaxID=3024236 RepID=A0ABT1NCF7_9FIRM|nr:tripartite tricarboxylate transporter permease [Lutispora saccharofermentans]MCQ1528945.1 tripartite tricarboxylate transporter permease [Lutispora saccharofermentans]